VVKVEAGDRVAQVTRAAGGGPGGAEETENGAGPDDDADDQPGQLDLLKSPRTPRKK
jgi:hypothetical protein